jgi:hypothetical protein
MRGEFGSATTKQQVGPQSQSAQTPVKLFSPVAEEVREFNEQRKKTAEFAEMN